MAGQQKRTLRKHKKLEKRRRNKSKRRYLNYIFDLDSNYKKDPLYKIRHYYIDRRIMDKQNSRRIRSLEKKYQIFEKCCSYY